MGYPTKVQLIERNDSQQFYINFPCAKAEAAMEDSMVMITNPINKPIIIFLYLLASLPNASAADADILFISIEDLGIVTPPLNATKNAAMTKYRSMHSINTNQMIGTALKIWYVLIS